MEILVIGGTGTVGSEVVRELGKHNANVTVLTRQSERPSSLPKDIKYITGDLLEPETVDNAFNGKEAVFLLNPVSTTEAHQGLTAVNKARIAGVKHLVYLSVHNVDQATHLPHFGAKIPVEIALKNSGIPYTILRPNNFFQNDLWLKDSLLDNGVYPNPIGSQGLSRVDVRDIAEAAAITLTTARYEGQTFNIVGPQSLTGRRCAEIWGNALNRPVQYGGDDLNSWEKEASKQMPGWMILDLKLMFAFFQQHGLTANENDIQRLTDLLGHPPRTFEDFAKETAEAWL